MNPLDLDYIAVTSWKNLSRGVDNVNMPSIGQIVCSPGDANLPSRLTYIKLKITKNEIYNTTKCSFFSGHWPLTKTHCPGFRRRDPIELN